MKIVQKNPYHPPGTWEKVFSEKRLSSLKLLAKNWPIDHLDLRKVIDECPFLKTIEFEKVHFTLEMFCELQNILNMEHMETVFFTDCTFESRDFDLIRPPSLSLYFDMNTLENINIHCLDIHHSVLYINFEEKKNYHLLISKNFLIMWFSSGQTHFLNIFSEKQKYKIKSIYLRSCHFISWNLDRNIQSFSQCEKWDFNYVRWSHVDMDTDVFPRIKSLYLNNVIWDDQNLFAKFWKKFCAIHMNYFHVSNMKHMRDFDHVIPLETTFETVIIDSCELMEHRPLKTRKLHIEDNSNFINKIIHPEVEDLKVSLRASKCNFVRFNPPCISLKSLEIYTSSTSIDFRIKKEFLKRIYQTLIKLEVSVLIYHDLEKYQDYFFSLVDHRFTALRTFNMVYNLNMNDVRYSKNYSVIYSNVFPKNIIERNFQISCKKEALIAFYFFCKYF